MKKIYTFSAVLFFSFLTVSPVQAAEIFSDVDSASYFGEAISELKQKKIVQGYTDGTYQPNNHINRSEFSKITIGSLYSVVSDSNCFPDVKTEWFAKYVCFAKSKQIIDGYPDGLFRPAQNINLAEALKIVLPAYNVQLANIADSTLWYSKYLETAKAKGYLTKINSDPAHFLSRGEMAQLIFNISHASVSPSPTPTPNPGQDSNTYSWDGSWTPSDSDFPIAGLLDEKYSDGHVVEGEASPLLPPGEWDWKEGNNVAELANWSNFSKNIGTFEPLKDSLSRQYGWKLKGNNSNIEYTGPAYFFTGSNGTDILNLGSQGSISSFDGNMGDGPDVLVFNKSWSLDFRTGSSVTGSKYDNDLVIAGCSANSDSSFDIATTTIHTGPGNDLVFVRDMERAAIDAGNGGNGRTDTIDPNDGDDVVVFKGNMLDFRYFGGNGNDTAVWYVDEVNQSESWLGPAFFGGGGLTGALWEDNGTDRLVMVIPPETEVIGATSELTKNGQFRVFVTDKYAHEETTELDEYSNYCLTTCGTSPSDQKTLVMEYRSANGKVFTAHFFVTDFEELQIGVGANAKVYKLDDINGKATLDTTLKSFTPPEFPASYCDAQ